MGPLTVERRLADVRVIVPLWSPLLSILPGLAWITLATWLAPAGWFHGAVVDNLWGRFFHGLYHPRPWYFFFIQFPTRSMPWSLFWPVVAWAAWRRVFVAHGDPERARAWRFLLAWVGVMFIFFSISAGKRELYMVPAMPAGALLTADALLVLLAQGSAVPRWWTAGPSSRPPRRAPASRSSSTHASLTSTFRDCSASCSSRSRRRRRSRGGGSDASELPRSDVWA